MARKLLAGGSLAALMGAALVPPVLMARAEAGGLTALGIGIVSAACGLVGCGVTAVLVGMRQRVSSPLPSGVRAAIAANALFLAFFALELSDRLIRQDGRLFYWSTFLLVPALALFSGLLAAKRWAWWTSRGAAALGVLWFGGFLAVIPFVHLQSGGVSVPWQGRVYMACVTLALGSVLGGAFWSLGRPDARSYFGLIRSGGSEAA